MGVIVANLRFQVKKISFPIKVSKSWKQFLEFLILPKNEQKTWKSYPKSSQDNFFSCFVRFLEELRITTYFFRDFLTFTRLLGSVYLLGRLEKQCQWKIPSIMSSSDQITNPVFTNSSQFLAGENKPILVNKDFLFSQFWGVKNHNKYWWKNWWQQDS